MIGCPAPTGYFTDSKNDQIVLEIIDSDLSEERPLMVSREPTLADISHWQKSLVEEADDDASTAPSFDLDDSDDNASTAASLDLCDNANSGLNPEAVPWIPTGVVWNSAVLPHPSPEAWENWACSESLPPPGLAPPGAWNPETFESETSATVSLETSTPPGLAPPGTTNSEIKFQFNRTRLCTFYARGHCFHGESCKYAHTNDQLQSVPDLRKTRLCFSYFRGECQKTNCCFAHGYHELRSTNNLFKTELCFQWSTSGRCKAGINCRYAHGQKELRPPGL